VLTRVQDAADLIKRGVGGAHTPARGRGVLARSASPPAQGEAADPARANLAQAHRSPKLIRFKQNSWLWPKQHGLEQAGAQPTFCLAP